MLQGQLLHRALLPTIASEAALQPEHAGQGHGHNAHLQDALSVAGCVHDQGSEALCRFERLVVQQVC